MNSYLRIQPCITFAPKTVLLSNVIRQHLLTVVLALRRLQVGQYVTVNGDVVSHLNISSIHTNDGGLYKCIASSKVGSAEHAAKLNVYGLPFIRPMEKKAIVAGETLIVTCPVAGYPIDTIVWEKGL
jgi:hypothetical protein